ncbi:MAG: TetR/AcrR family transcriptional regulator [Rhizobiaceae bacterium]
MPVDNLLGSMFFVSHSLMCEWDERLSVIEALMLETTNENSPPTNSHADILSAAARCFKENGFSATSIDDVAHSLGATKGRIYHHFRSKTDLFFAVYRRGMEINFQATLPQSKYEGDTLTRLARMGLTHAVTMMAYQDFQRVLLQGVTMHQTGSTTAAQRVTLDELIEIRNQYEALFRTAIEAVAKEQKLVLTNPSVVSKSFLAVLNSSVFWYTPRVENDKQEQINLARELVTFALNGFGATLSADADLFLGELK